MKLCKTLIVDAEQRIRLYSDAMHGVIKFKYLCIPGSRAVQAELHKGYPNASIAVDMASAVVHAIKSVCIIPNERRRIRLALLTPYIDSVHQKNIDYLNENGIDVVIDHNLGFKADKQTTSMSPVSIYEHVKCLASICSDIDVFFVGCSAFRSTGIY